MKKILIAYFSCSGVTKKAAGQLADILKANLYEIQPETPYTQADLDWRNAQSRSSIEMNNPGSRPKMAGMLPGKSDFDVLFVGFPIWWYVAPRIVNTFLAGLQLAGKTVVPFCTSGSSGVGKSDTALHSMAPDAHWLPGKLVNGMSRREMTEWAEKLPL